MRAIFVQDSRFREFIIHAFVKAGSCADPVGKKGLAHLVEHFFAQPVASLTERSGRKFAQWAGFTYSHHTYCAWYADPEHYKTLVDRASRHLRPPAGKDDRWDAAFLRKNRADVLEELAAKAAAPNLFKPYRLLYKTAFVRRPERWYPLGSPAHIRRLGLGDVRRFVRAHFRPDGMVLVCTGPVRTGLVRREVAARFRDHAPGTAAERPVREPVQRRQRRTSLRTGLPKPRLLIAFKAPRFSSANDPVLRLLYHLFFQPAFVRRLKAAVENAYCFLPTARDGRLLEVFAALRHGRFLRRAEAMIFRQAERIRNGKVRSDEVDAARREAIAACRRERRSPVNLAHRLAAHELFGGGYEKYLGLSQALAAVKAEDVLSNAADVFAQSRSTVVVER